MNPDHLLDFLQEKSGDALINSEINKTQSNSGQVDNYGIWIECNKENIHPIIKKLSQLQAPHITVISGSDEGEKIELIYHLTLGYGEGNGEVSLHLRTTVNKQDPTIGTITDLIPGALSTEREMHEFMGINFEGIPDSRKLFLPEEIEAHPWRDDDERVEDYVKSLDEQP